MKTPVISLLLAAFGLFAACLARRSKVASSPPTSTGRRMKIPYGSTITYGELASQLGRASAVRAVANANAANVLSLFVPCHRVIGRHHALTGYRGGLEAKRHLLQLESNLLI